MKVVIHCHMSCFDGVVSAALGAWVIEHTCDGTLAYVEPVDYGVSASWMNRRFEQNVCVVDFLYHPQARFWWDHHGTTILRDDWRGNYEKRKSAFVKWDRNAPSCARVISGAAAELRLSLPRHLLEAVDWADKLDSANYSSAEEAVLATSPAKQLALSLRIDKTIAYHTEVVRSLLSKTLLQVVSVPTIRTRIEEAMRLHQKGLALVRQDAYIKDGLAVYDVEVTDELVDRMIPYLLDPDVRYALSIVRRSDQIRISCNASPWIARSGPDLGHLFKRFGGGGHRDIGSVLLPRSRSEVVDSVKQEVIRELAESG